LELNTLLILKSHIYRLPETWFV